MKEILIFGDSNSWGYVPGKGSRYPRGQRWPGVAEKLLGSDYKIIEDCISGRTTMYEDPDYPNRNGLCNLGYSLCAAYPIDLFVLLLGTNDLKFTGLEGVRAGLEKIVETVLNSQELYKLDHPVFKAEKKLLLISPPVINAEIARLRPEHRLSGAAELSVRLKDVMMEVAEKYGAEYLDITALAAPETTDCLHLSVECHERIGAAAAERIRSMLG